MHGGQKHQAGKDRPDRRKHEFVFVRQIYLFIDQHAQPDPENEDSQGNGCVFQQKIICALVSVAENGIEVGTIHLNILAVIGLLDINPDDVRRIPAQKDNRQAHQHIHRGCNEKMQNGSFAGGDVIIQVNRQNKDGLQFEGKRDTEQSKRRYMLPSKQIIKGKQNESDIDGIALRPKSRIEADRDRAEHHRIGQRKNEGGLFPGELAYKQSCGKRKDEIENDRQKLVRIE